MTLNTRIGNIWIKCNSQDFINILLCCPYVKYFGIKRTISFIQNPAPMPMLKVVLLPDKKEGYREVAP